MTPDEEQQFKSEILAPEEGRVPWLYLDTRGNATCGEGHLVASYAAALALPFTPAITPGEWAALRAAAWKQPASHYAQFTEGRLSDPQIDALAGVDLASRTAELRLMFPAWKSWLFPAWKSWPGWDSWPSSAQFAMLDIYYNAGLAGFPRLVLAARACDWQACAVQCHRLGISDQRNADTRARFLQAGQIHQGGATVA